MLDIKKAIFWLNKAAIQRNLEAQFILGKTLYDQGKNKEAKKWIKIAIENGNEDAKLFGMKNGF